MSLHNTGYYFGLLFILSVSIFGCKKDSNNPTEPPKTTSVGFIPLAVGNQWIWRYTYYDTAGHALYTHYDTLTILSDTSIANEKWYLAPWLAEFSFGTNRSSGFWVWGQARTIQVGSQPAMWYKYPCSIGDRYYLGVSVADTSYPIAVLDTSAQVVVPLGTFRCYKYLFGNPSPGTERYLGIVYISPGEGEILRENLGFIYSGQYVFSRSELVFRVLK
jgi:hypothetical protein